MAAPYRALASLTLALIWACADAYPSGDWPGDAVDQVPVALAGASRLADDPRYTLGGDRENDHGQVLHLTTDAVLHDDGGISVASQGLYTITRYDSTGAFVATTGRSGDGPGDYRILRSLHRITRDTLAAWDPALRRLTLIGPDHEAISTITVDEARGPRGFTPLNAHSVGPASLFVVYYNRRAQTRPQGLSRETMRISVLARDGTERRDLGVFSGTEFFGDGQSSIAAPLSFRFLVAADSGAFYLGNGVDPRLVVFRRDGEALHELVLPIERHPLTETEWRTVRDRFVTTRIAVQERSEIRDMLDRALTADSVPAFLEMFGTTNGGLWLRLYHSPAECDTWMIVDPEHRTAHTICLPLRATVLDAIADRVAILVTNELDREEIRIYSIEQAENAQREPRRGKNP